MTIQTSKYQSFYWLLLWLGVSALSYYLVYLKYLALDFHTRDYAFYTEFIIKWSKPVSEQYYSMNPGGYNFLGISAVDGCNGFYQWVHFEPIRFIQAFIYRITHSLQAVFIFNSLLVCSPVLIIGSWLKNMNASIGGKLIWILLFVAFPATLLAAGYDNRPSMFLGVGYFWILYTHLATEHKGLQVLSFLLLFLIREEALILNGIVCFYMFLQWRKQEVKASSFFIYVAVLLVYAIALYNYFNYWNYHFFSVNVNPYPSIIMVGAIATIVLWTLYAFIRRNSSMILFIPMVLFAAQLLSMKINGTFPDEKFQYFNDPRWLMVFLVFLALALYGRMQNKTLLMYANFMILPIFIILTFFGTYGIHGKIGYYRSTYRNTKAVFDLIPQIKMDDTIIVDYSTHQAFLGYKNLYCIDRLPCTFDKSTARFYPENKREVNRLINRADWFVVGRQDRLTLDPFTQDFKDIENSKFTIVKFKK